MVDSRGLVTTKSTVLTPEKAEFARADVPPSTGIALEKVISTLRVTTLIGASGKQGAFTTSVIQAVTSNCVKDYRGARPVIFALSNPFSAIECLAQDAYRDSEWRAVYASGTENQPLTDPDGQLIRPAQANNAFVFPGMGLAALSPQFGGRSFTQDDFYQAAIAISRLITDKDLQEGAVLPTPERIIQANLQVAAAVVAENGARGIDNDVLKELEDTKYVLPV
jgi:malic enzyme